MTVRRRWAALGAALAIMLSSVPIGPLTPAVARAAACPKVWATDVANAQTTADGGAATWRLRTLSATDWATNGFAAQVLWVGTDSTAFGLGKWVEVGVTKGWAGQNLYTYYTANGNHVTGEYHESRITTITPTVNTTHTFRSVYLGSPSLWAAQIDSTSVSVSPFGPSTKWVEAGLESTCNQSRVDNTYVSAFQYRASSDHTYKNFNNGDLLENTQAPAKVAWCTTNVRFHYALNTVRTYDCS
jgi:hypothetical protein